MPFSSLGLSAPLVQAIQEQNYEKPTPIQAEAIPAVLSGRDIMAAAQTGTGKTAGFTLPILEKLSQGEKARNNRCRALILTPTRELAAQVGDNIAAYSKHTKISSDVVFGGVKVNPQMMRLRGGVDILVATPGRLLDLAYQRAIRFDQLEVLVLDEADRMLDMGFIHDIKKILERLPKNRQNLLFSATFSDDIRELAKRFIHNPIEVSVTPENSTAKTVKQWMIPVDKHNKSSLLSHLIHERKLQQALVFIKTKHGANKLVRQLDTRGITALAIHGNKSQGARTKALADFKSGEVRILVATDIAARGIDIEQLPHVINYDLPHVPEDYVHRIGRTGRAGSVGEAISLVSNDDFKNLCNIESLIGELLEREIVDEFAPVKEVPISILNFKPKKIKKPKKPKDEGQDRNSKSEGRKKSSPPGKGAPKNSEKTKKEYKKPSEKTPRKRKVSQSSGVKKRSSNKENESRPVNPWGR